ncbi:histidinol-phosphate transaminase [Gammaproteobacteria bacterium AB-CW1]|uniref:Histidinol-phosphate aminotransferase n=1 Tax=Natronospira elongata TaxID=3110268 RepID=A0AAP6JE90_9GAMM|nr:histidinol-phosphate transaminase [Gammaproteobacteria bacterium AB-CW1]
MSGQGVRVQDLVRPEILAGSPYQVADARGLLKLDAMEAPAGLPAGLEADWQARVAGLDWHRYPDSQASALKAALREQFAIDDRLGLLLGNGSDEIIQMLTLALARHGASLMTPEPGFAIYKVAARNAGMDYHALPLDEQDFSLDLDRALAEMERLRPALIFIANPNNPTGNAFSPDQLQAIADAAPGLVVVDEAYFPHTDIHCLDRAGRPANLAVMRTLSKAGMAGLRLGWLVADPAWIDALERLRMPYNINVLTQAAARFALENGDWWRSQAELVREERARLYQRLQGLDGVHVWPSEANFLLLRVADAPTVHARMKAAGVLVKCLDGAHPALSGCLRLTVGSPADNEILFEALAAAIR